LSARQERRRGEKERRRRGEGGRSSFIPRREEFIQNVFHLRE
jgi:hypothetical protein